MRGQGALAAMENQSSTNEHFDSLPTAASLPAKMRLSDGTLLDGRVADISHAGVGLVSPRFLPVGQLCRVFVDLSVNEAFMELNLMAHVCYSREQSPGEYRIGMRFADLEPESEVLLAAVLA